MCRAGADQVSAATGFWRDPAVSWFGLLWFGWFGFGSCLNLAIANQVEDERLHLASGFLKCSPQRCCPFGGLTQLDADSGVAAPGFAPFSGGPCGISH